MNHSEIHKGLISCIIPVYNRQELIVECIDSVLSQTYKNYEILVIDDGSTDNTKRSIEALIKKHPLSLNYFSQNNQGPGAARQTGLNHAQGEFVQFLDSDDLIKENKFELYINEFNSSFSPDIVFSITHYYSTDNPDEFSIWKQSNHYADSILPGFLTSRAWSTSTPLYRKAILDKAGVILPLSCEEDLEYDCRIGLQLPKISFINQQLTDFRDHGGQRFSVNNPDRAKQLSHQIQAREGIYQTIRKSSIANSNQHVNFFAQSLFLLSRQAGEMGLASESKKALLIAQSIGSLNGSKHKLAMGIYKLICQITTVKNGSRIFNTLYDRMHQIRKHFKKPT